jgi:hypothetical protein
MADPEPFTISSRRLSYKDLELTYRDASRTLIVSVEMSGIREFDFVGVDTSFAQWADPPGLTLNAEEQSAVKSRIHQWSVSEGLRLGFGPPVDMEAYFAKRQAEGWKIVRGRDAAGLATVTFVPSLRLRLRMWLVKLRRIATGPR